MKNGTYKGEAMFEKKLMKTEPVNQPMERKASWHAFYTNSRSEKKVFERLKKAGFESCLPMVTEVKQWSDRKKKVQVPLIKSYVFVKSTNKDLIPILNVPGVVTVLKYLGKPAIVKEHEIENLKILGNNSDAIAVVPKIDLTKGKLVQVTQGPFKDLMATILNESGKHRVVVHVEALNSFIEVTMPLSHIEDY